MFGLKSLGFVTDLIEAGQFASSHNLMVSSCGNLSMRVSEDAFAITASGSHLGQLSAADIALCSLNNPQDYDGPRPSIETSFHQKIFNVRDDVGAILHFQSPFATALACSEEPAFNLNFIPEIPAYIKKVSLVPWFAPGSEDLALAVRAAASDQECHIIVLGNHGQIALGKDLKQMMRNAQFFELACQIATCSKAPLRRFTEQELMFFNNA